MKHIKHDNQNKVRYVGFLLVTCILFVGTFVIAKAGGIDEILAGELSGTEQIDALVKSIMQGAGAGADTEAASEQASDAGANGAVAKTPKRAIVLDDEEILDSVEVIGDVSEGAKIQAIAFNKDMTIADALRFLALKFHKNIIPSPNVDGMITITNLYDVSFEQALKAIIGANKYVIDDNGFIYIYTPEEYFTDTNRMASEVIKLKYITAAEAEKLIEPVLSSAGSIASTSPAMVDTTAGSGGDSLAHQDRIVLKDYPEIIAEAKRIIDDIDVAPLQILIEVTILEATLNETTQFGIDWNLFGLKGLGTLGRIGLDQSNFAPNVSSGPGMAFGFYNSEIEVLINALEEITDTTVLANPKILALNKQAGKLLIGRETGYKVTTTTDTSTTETIEFMESGTLLEFRPFVCDDGMIRMEIHPEQSEASFNATTQAPDKSTTTVQTNILVKDGKTIVLGGLFKEKTNLTRNQVPVLGDIPVAGNIFKGVNDESERVELIVLITPHIINDPDDARGAERMDDVHRINDDARGNINWTSRARRSEDRYLKAVNSYLDGNTDEALRLLNSIRESDRTYLEAERLREKILNEKEPDNIDRIKRIMLDNIQREDNDKWMQR